MVYPLGFVVATCDDIFDVKRSVCPVQLSGIVDANIHRIAMWPKSVEGFLKHPVAVPIAVDAAMLHLAPGQARVMLDVEVLTRQLEEEHVLHPGYMLPQRGCVMVTTSYVNLPHIQPLAEVTALPSPPTKVSGDD